MSCKKPSAAVIARSEAISTLIGNMGIDDVGVDALHRNVHVNLHLAVLEVMYNAMFKKGDVKSPSRLLVHLTAVVRNRSKKNLAAGWDYLVNRAAKLGFHHLSPLDQECMPNPVTVLVGAPKAPVKRRGGRPEKRHPVVTVVFAPSPPPSPTSSIASAPSTAASFGSRDRSDTCEEEEPVVFGFAPQKQPPSLPSSHATDGLGALRGDSFVVPPGFGERDIIWRAPFTWSPVYGFRVGS